MFNKMKEEKAVTNTQEIFGNWELSDELDDADLMAVAGGAELSLAVQGPLFNGGALISFDDDVNVNADLDFNDFVVT
jgi:hypothetical protein